MNIQTKLEEIEAEFNNWNSNFYERLPLDNKQVEKLKSFYTSQIKSLLKEYVEWAEGMKFDLPPTIRGIEDIGLLKKKGWNEAIDTLTEPLKELLDKK